MTPGRQLELLTQTAVDVERPEELLDKLRRGRPLRVKAGFDPSAPDLHLGHSIPMDVLKLFQDLGHTVVFIVGDFTARIGDPSGKLKSRPVLTDAEIEAHAQTYFEQVGHILDVDKAEVRSNSEWLEGLDFAGVLRLSGSYTVARMLERDTFAQRTAADEPITITEMLYPLAQGYDSVAIEADVEIGGTDQLFNLLVARDVQRHYGQEPEVIMTFPLLVGLDGVEKMSSSLGNTVALTDPPAEMYGKLMSINDEVMLDYYRLLLKPPEIEIEDMRSRIEAREVNPRDIKARLALQVTTRYHGEEAAQAAQKEFDQVFAQGRLPSEMPEVAVGPDDLAQGGILLSRLITRAGLATSGSQARRLIEQGAVRLDDERITDPWAAVDPKSGAVLRVGRRRFARIVRREEP
ncbi:MAG: tyrosine--tRNA ligase [Armatimonadota bacterium]